MKRAVFALFSLMLIVSASGLAAQEPVGVLASPGHISVGPPVELQLERAGSMAMDMRKLPSVPPRRRDRPERPEPQVERIELPGGVKPAAPAGVPGPSAPMPSPVANYLGLDYANWGAGRPPDTVGDVGPTHYIQAVNTSIGIFRKSDNVRVAAFTFDTLMSHGAFGNLCDTDNYGDPVVLYDSFEDRWLLTDFAFQLDGFGNVVSPPGAYQCFAVSRTGDPVLGGWNFYSLHITDGLNDYPKFGIWPDGIYMAANMFGFPAGGSYMGTRVWALNKAQMYANEAAVQVVQFSPPAAEFTFLPANARLQTGTPPAGSPNYFSVIWQYLNAVSVYKFHVDWGSISLSTFTGPFITIAPASWAVPPGTVAAQGGTNNDTLAVRLMMQNQYANLGGVESLWNTHTVLGGAASTAAPRYYQVTVTGGTVAATTTQAATHTPDTTVQRYMPSLAVDRAGNMALGYSASSSALYPAIRYAGRLSGDPVSTLPQTETSLVAGTGSQNTSNRWGDYSAMTLDPDGCTFWYANEYYITTGNNWQTRVGSFRFPACTSVTSGTLQGTVTATVGGAPISGATITFGSRTTTTNGSGFYQFLTIPSGTYTGITASAPGYVPGSAATIVVTDGATTTQNFSLATAPTSSCPVDTTQSDFQAGVPTNVDLTTSPGDVILLNTSTIDQQNTTVTNSGFGFTSASWAGQTFTAGLSGQLTQVELNLFCSGCTGTTPSITVSIRATSGGLPTGADLATATIPGFSSGAGGYFTATFGSPATITVGTLYAVVVRAVSNPSAGTYAYVCSCTSPDTNPYGNGQRVTSSNSGLNWAADTTSGGRDLGFKIYMQTGYAGSGDLVSSRKDSNPPVGFTPNWSTLSWTGSTPTATTLKFQAAGNSSAAGPLSFVGPDGTAATFFTTSGASLGQFNGYRYLKYRAYFATTDSTKTPTLNDVTVCYTAVSVATADLAITSSDGVSTAVPGGLVTYNITASNATSTPATGATVTDAFPAVLVCAWTCAGAGGGVCTASGSGNINDIVNLPGSSSVTYTASCAILTSATGSLSNTATVTLAGDPNAANNSATDTDTLTPQANLAVTNTDGVTTANPGGSVTYTIVASNAGPSNAPGSTVTNTFPAALTCTWTCVGTGGGACTASGSGNIGDTVNLPASGNATYTASCTISSSATGTLSNTATVSAPGGVTDPIPGNNSFTDTDTLVPGSTVSGTKTVSGPFSVGGTATYTVTLHNSGAGTQADNAGNEFTDVLPPELALVSAAATSGIAVASTAANMVTWNGSIPAGGSVTITIAATIRSVAPGTTISNQGTIAFDADGNGTNEASALTDDPAKPAASDPTTFSVLEGFFFTIEPCRLVDTRLPDGPYGGPALPALSARTFVAAGQCGIPAGATAISINITVTAPSTAGYLRAYKAGITPSVFSTISYGAGATRANSSVVALGDGDFVVSIDQPTGTLHVIIDVNGYFR